MPRKSLKAKLILDQDKKMGLQRIADSRKAPLREVQRAKILLRYSEGMSVSDMEKTLHVSRPTVYKWIDKALALGVEEGLKDKYHRPKEPAITEEAKAWVINLACTKPGEHGYAAEVWTRKALANHARKYGPDCLRKAAKATIQRILDAYPLRPHKMAYYLLNLTGRWRRYYASTKKSVFRTKQEKPRPLLPYQWMRNLECRLSRISRRTLCRNRGRTPE
jgi:transposase